MSGLSVAQLDELIATKQLEFAQQQQVRVSPACLLCTDLLETSARADRPRLAVALTISLPCATKCP